MSKNISLEEALKIQATKEKELRDRENTERHERFMYVKLNLPTIIIEEVKRYMLQPENAFSTKLSLSVNELYPMITPRKETGLFFKTSKLMWDWDEYRDAMINVKNEVAEKIAEQGFAVDKWGGPGSFGGFVVRWDKLKKQAENA